MAVALAGGAIGYTQTTGGSGGGGGLLANLFVDTNGGTCARSSTAVVYADAAACSTFDAANDLAQNGDVIGVEPGTYAKQSVTDSNGRTSQATIQPDSSTPGGVLVNAPSTGNGAVGLSLQSVNYLKVKGTMIGGLADGNSTFRFDGPVKAQIQINGTSDNDTIQGVDAASFTATGTNLLFTGNDWGPNIGSATDYPNTPLPEGHVIGNTTTLTIDGDNIHDSSCNPCDATNVHSNGMYVFSTAGLTIRNTKFWRNSISDIRIQCVQCTSMANIVLENNWFGIATDCTTCTTARSTEVSIDTAPTGPMRVAFNTFGPDAGKICNQTLWNCGSASFPVVFAGNIFALNGTEGCNPNSTYSYNVQFRFSGNPLNSACGTDTLQAAGTDATWLTATTYANPIDFHLTTGPWAADNFVPCGSVSGGCPATDIDGVSRPINTNADAGSDERP